jgi:hypothetical protein
MPDRPAPTAEHARLAARDAKEEAWDRWGPYLADRAWGTVREDAGPGGGVWESFPHDHSRSRAYRWNEDGLAGISDDRGYLCFAVALWNGEDPILKERLFGLTGPEGNHGESVKEEYWHLDATPSHSLLEFGYRYPHRRFPYEQLIEQSAALGLADPEPTLRDTGVFEGGRWFDVTVAYAKAAPDDMVIEITVANHGPDPASCHVLPTLWFRNTWSWGYPEGPMGDVLRRPEIRAGSAGELRAEHPVLGTYHLYDAAGAIPVFTENETNRQRLWGEPNPGPVKDAFGEWLVGGDDGALGEAAGTKAAFVHRLDLGPGASASLRLRLTASPEVDPFDGFETVLARRRAEADAFYAAVQCPDATAEQQAIQRAAWAGMIWTKQLYSYDVEQWLDGDPAGHPPWAGKRRGHRNADWRHLNNHDVISMPDGWEYPWYAAWDSAFHAVVFAAVDPAFAKGQLELFTREWYQHPNGQLPAYEWEFGDVNPPVHAWAARRVYEIDAALRGHGDTAFLKRIFHKLLINFTWWVNRKDDDGNNVFEGGFLGLDNISMFDRSRPLPGGGRLDQSDGTAWMAVFTLDMLAIAIELSRVDAVYQDVATKFFEHFLGIATAMSAEDHALWDEADGFYYDVLRFPDGRVVPLPVRSLVGLIPLLAVTAIDQETMDDMPGFSRRMHWFLNRKPHLSGNVARIDDEGAGHRHLAAILTPEHLRSVLRYLLDPEEFLSPHGIRSLSRHHRDHPIEVEVEGESFRIGYEPAESQSGLFGGNSNWRGPVWFPLNYLIVEALERFHAFFGEGFTVECPTGSGVEMDLAGVAAEIRRRLVSLFETRDGRRPYEGSIPPGDPVLFHEYFDGDDGSGLGASHQTGWTALVADLIGWRLPEG